MGWPSQRSGRKASGSPKCAGSTAGGRLSMMTPVPLGSTRSPTLVSTLAVCPITGATGRRRRVSVAIAPVHSSLLAISTSVGASQEPRMRSASARNGAILSGPSSR